MIAWQLQLLEAGGSLPDAVGYETGSYVGTGTYGLDNALSITFSKVPLFLMVYCLDDNYVNFGLFNPIFLTTGYTECGYAVLKSASLGLAVPTSRDLLAKVDGTTLTWYTTRTSTDHISCQLNTNNKTYNWVAFYAES